MELVSVFRRQEFYRAPAHRIGRYCFALSFIVFRERPGLAVACRNPNTADRVPQPGKREQGTFKDITPRVRNELVAKQTEFIDLTEGKQSLDELSRDDQMRAINTLEWIKAAVTKAENERVVCERVKMVGSNRPQRVCRTVGEMRLERDAAVKVMEERNMCGAACRGN